MDTPERYERLPLDHIRPPEKPSRTSIDPDKLGELADSMAAEGLYQAIGVRGPFDDGTWETMYGDRRRLAALLLRWPTIECRIYPRDYDPRLARASENFQRADLSPLEEAGVCKDFRDAGMPLAHVARLLRRSPAWVTNRLALLGLPPDLQEIVQARALPLAVVELLAQVDHEDYRRALVRDAIQHGASCATVEVWLAHYHQDRQRIISNHLAVEQIIADRATFVITYPCDWCEDLAPYEHTRGWRLCARCSQQLAAAKTTTLTSR